MTFSDHIENVLKKAEDCSEKKCWGCMNKNYECKWSKRHMQRSAKWQMIKLSYFQADANGNPNA